MYSVQIAVSDGTLTRISLSIEYFEKDDITLYRNLDTTPLVLGTDWQWDGDTTINLLTNIPVPDGDYITVRRNTNIDRAFNIYDGGAAFSRDTLDENFKQMIYLAQEFTEGNGLTGLFFPLDMHGFQIKNLGDPTDPKDAVTKQYVDTANTAQDTAFANGQAAQDAAVAASQAVQDNRLASLENTFVQVTSSYPWFTTTTTETDTLSPGLTFTKAALYLNGVRQTPEESYIIVSNQILLATTVPVGTVVLASLGEDVDNPDGYATTAQLMAVQLNLDNDINAVASDVSTRAASGANSDITSLTGLTTALSIAQGGTGAGTAPLARTALGLGGAAVLNVGTSTGTVADGGVVDGLVQKVRKKMEVYYSGLSLAIPTSSTNFVNLIKALTPNSGALNAFFNTASDKLNVYNDNTSVLFKVNITGSWTTTSSNRSMVMSFTGTNGNTLTATRVENTSPDVIQFNTYFSVDVGGNIVTNGAPITIQSNGSVFTATSILVTVEQVTNVSAITPV